MEEYRNSSLRLTEKAWEALEIIYQREVAKIGMKVSKTEVLSRFFEGLVEDERT